MSEKIEHYRFKDFESYKLWLNEPPKETHLMSRDIGGSKTVPYEPIEVKEALADFCFREWNVVDEKYMNVLNEIVCTVKISALPDYPGSDYFSFTGSASKPVQTDSGSKVHEFPLGKKANALEYCLPAVRSEAIGNALETLGNRFGRNVARKVGNDFGFKLAYKKDEPVQGV